MSWQYFSLHPRDIPSDLPFYLLRSSNDVQEMLDESQGRWVSGELLGEFEAGQMPAYELDERDEDEVARLLSVMARTGEIACAPTEPVPSITSPTWQYYLVVDDSEPWSEAEITADDPPPEVFDCLSYGRTDLADPNDTNFEVLTTTGEWQHSNLWWDRFAIGRCYDDFYPVSAEHTGSLLTRLHALERLERLPSEPARGTATHRGPGDTLPAGDTLQT